MIIPKIFHALLLFLVEERLLDAFAALLRQRLVMINVYVAAVVDGLRTLHILILHPGRFLSSFTVLKYL